MSAKRAPERIEELRQRLLDGMAERGIPVRCRRGHLRQDPGLLQLRVPRVARDQLRLPGLRQRLAEAVLPGRVHRRAAAQPADGLLRPAQPDRRRPAARGHRARRGRQRQRRAGHPGGPAQLRPGPRPAIRLGLSAVRNLGTQAAERSRPAARTGTWRTSPPGPACRPRRSRRWPRRVRSAASGSAGAPRCGRPGPPPRCARGSCPAPPPGCRAAAARDDTGRGDHRRSLGHRHVRHPPGRARPGGAQTRGVLPAAALSSAGVGGRRR